MGSQLLIRTGSLAAVAGAVCQLVATILEPDVSDEPLQGINTVATSDVWVFGRILDVVGVLLTVTALAIVAGTFSREPGRGWARTGLPILAVLGATGVLAGASGGALKDIADAWSGADASDQQSYVAVFDAMRNATDNIFFVAFLSMGLYLATLAAAILSSDLYPRWLGWASAVSALLIVGGNLAVLAAGDAFVVLLLGFALFLLITVALGVIMWRQADLAETAGR